MFKTTRNRSCSLIICVTFALTCIVTNVHAQVIAKGNFAIDIYYGFPNLLTSSIKDTYIIKDYHGNRNESYNIKNVGPVGARVEYFINGHLAIGADANYSISDIRWAQSESRYDSNTGVYTTYLYNYRAYVPRLRVLGKVNFHFGKSEHFDWYAGAGVGVNYTTVTITSEDPVYVNDRHLPLSLTFPFSTRIDAGGRYYFTKNAGIGIEMGVGGGPIASVDLSLKF